MAKWSYILAFQSIIFVLSVSAETTSSETFSAAESSATSNAYKKSYSESGNEGCDDEPKSVETFSAAESSATSYASSSSYSESGSECYGDEPKSVETFSAAESSATSYASSSSYSESGSECYDDVICGENEEYDICPAPCPPRRCDVDERIIRCAAPPQPGDPDCKPGCRCSDNFYKNDQNVCVPKNKCPVKCKDNEVYDVCPPQCPPQKCGVNPAVILCLPNPQPGDKECEPGCRCIDDYYKNDFGDCIPKDKCPKCGENEVYDVCPAPCPTRKCEDVGKLMKCKAPPSPGDPDCQPGCRCADDYYRNNQNICVPKNECPPKSNVTCGLDEVYSSCVNGGCGRWNCSQKAIICIKLKEGACREGCHCRENYLRTDNGTCVPADQCPLTCGENEEYDICPAPCPPRRCDVDERIISCAAPPQPGDPDCKPGCRCSDNFYKNDQNVCVPKNKCPVKCKDNEVYDVCPPQCPPQKCGVNPAVILCLPNPQPGDKDCEPGCRCIDDYYRNDLGDCIPKDQCPPISNVTCGLNEVYSSCVNGGCGRWNCSQTAILCIDLIEGACREGCHCKENFLRRDDGTCVPADQCPAICNGHNEISGCASSYPPQTCESIGKRHCPMKPVNETCIPTCLCKPNYYRNEIGYCISKKDCSTCGKNEVYDICPATCPPRRCDVDERIIRCKAPPKPGDPDCKPGCRCADTYYRNDKNICVPKNKCPVKCKGNEVYYDCVPKCPPQDCGADDRIILCPRNPRPGEPNCEPGCRCISNYYRNDFGDCIPKDLCPKNTTSTNTTT